MRKLKLYLKIVIFTLLSINCFAQTVLFNENFGTTAGVFPTGWATTGTAGTTGWNTFTTGASSGYTGSSGSGQFRTGSSATTMTLTYSNNLSTVGYTNINVIWGARRTSTQSAVTFEWSADGSVWDTITFTDVAANSTWALVNSGTNLSLPSGAEGISNLQFRWTATVVGASGYRIDDLIVSGTPASSVPSKLTITSVNAGNSPIVNNSFSISVQSQDTGGLASNVSLNTDFILSVATGTGALSGTVTGSILAGTNSATVIGILYSTAESDISLTATVTAGDALTAGTSSLFNVLDTANHLQFINVPATGFTATNLSSFTVEALRADNSVDVNFIGNITLAKLNGTGNISGTLSANAVAGVATFSDIQFNAADTYIISATSGTLASDTSGNIVISDVQNNATQLSFVGVPASGTTAVNLTSFTVEARKADNSVDTNYISDITIAIASGTGIISGTLTATTVAGIAAFNDVQFDAAGSYTISATSGILTPDTSGNIIISNPVTPANLPTTYNWAPASSYPQGWVNTGLTTYTTQGFPSADAGKFDNQDDNVVINYVGVADSLIYYLRGNSLSGAYRFDVMESADGLLYTTLVSHTDTSNLITGSYSQYIAFPANTTQFIKLVYTTKVSGNIGIDSTTVTAKIFPTQLVVSSVNNGIDPMINNPFDIIVQSQDGNGTPASVINNTDITLSVATGSGIIGGIVSGTIVAGTNSVTISGANYNVAETNVSITATVTAGDALTAGTSSLFNVLDTANHLQFINVPATGFTATNLSSFTVEALRADNSVDVNFIGNITLAKLNGTGNISGTLSANAVAGVATFSDIQFDAADTYIISATSGTLASDTSGNIVISDVPNNATKLVFVGVPATGTIAVNLTSFIVEARKADNSVDTNYISDITIAIASGTGIISGTLTATAVTGIATFNNIQFDAAGSYSIFATSGILTADTSGIIVISAPAVATQLAFINVPATGITSVNLTSFTVEARKADNSIDINYTTDITLTVVSGTGNITGTLTIAAIAGVATFSDIQFDAASTYTISANSGTLTTAISGNIVISDPVIAAILPTSYDWTPSSNYPQGWTNSGLTFYTTGNLAPNSGKFDTQDDNMIVFYDTSACIVEYYLKGNGLTIPYRLDLMESADGDTYTILATHSDTQNSLISTYQYFSTSPDLASRYIKFNYTVKTGGNIAIDDVLIDRCLEINKISTSEITVYPIPVKHILNINNIDKNSTVSILNILGETVYTSMNIKLNKVSVNMENMLPGFYILVTKNSKGDLNSFRFVKE